MYRPGELDQKISITREILVDDGLGGQSVTNKSLYPDIWAKIRSLSGGEEERYDKINAKETSAFIIRNRPDIKEDDRILWDGVQYNIRHIEKKSKRDLYLKIIAERGVAQ